MAYPDHYLMSYGGTLCEGLETWSNNIRFWRPTSGPLVFDYGAVLTDLAADIRTLAGNTASLWLGDTKCTWVKFNRIDDQGRYESDTESNTRFLSGADVIAGTVGSPYPAPQVTMAITFRTANERGPASKGRIFIPRPAAVIDVQGKVQSSQVTGLAGAYKTFIQNLGNWPGLDLNTLAPSVVSKVGTGKGAWITRVEVGNVADTQRRRRAQLVETRSSSTVPTPV